MTYKYYIQNTIYYKCYIGDVLEDLLIEINKILSQCTILQFNIDITKHNDIYKIFNWDILFNNEPTHMYIETSDMKIYNDIKTDKMIRYLLYTGSYIDANIDKIINTLSSIENRDIYSIAYVLHHSKFNNPIDILLIWNNITIIDIQQAIIHLLNILINPYAKDDGETYDTQKIIQHIMPSMSQNQEFNTIELDNLIESYFHKKRYEMHNIKYI